MDIDFYEEEYGSGPIAQKFYTCLECNENIIHEKTEIATHLQLVHKMSMFEYFQRHKSKILREMRQRKRRRIRINDVSNMTSKARKLELESFSLYATDLMRQLKENRRKSLKI